MRAVCPRGHEVIVPGQPPTKERCPHCGGPLTARPKVKKRSVRTVSGGLPSLGKRRP